MQIPMVVDFFCVIFVEVSFIRRSKLGEFIVFLKTCDFGLVRKCDLYSYALASLRMVHADRLLTSL